MAEEEGTVRDPGSEAAQLEAGTSSVPGTAVPVAVFFTSFVRYDFVNWTYLSEVWPLR
jgi:hypothetical protein